MKKLWISLLLCFVLLLALSAAAMAEGGVALNEENFPDETFRNRITYSYDKDSDGFLSDTEIASVTSLYYRWDQIHSLKGIEYFTALTYLSCESCGLTELDLSHNTALTYLDCGSNQLTTLDLSGLSSLTTLYCNSNQLTTLDLTGCRSLVSLYCVYNRLTTIDLSGCADLTTLYCFSNQLSELKLDGCAALDRIMVTSNQLSTLDLSGCPNISLLYCGGNPLPTLDIRPCQWLLAAADSTDTYTEGTTVRYYGEAGDGRSYDMILETTTELICGEKVTLTYLANGGVGAPEPHAWWSGVSPVLSMTYPTREGYFFLGWADTADAADYQYQPGEMLEPLTVDRVLYAVWSAADPNAEGIRVNAVNFPDKEFRNYVSYAFDSDYNGVLSDEEIQAATDIQFFSGTLTSLKGVEFFPAMQRISVSGKLTELDVSHNTALRRLDCYYSGLTALDLSHNTELTWLNCAGNSLTELDISHNTALEKFVCSNNQLTTLDVSRNTALVGLWCERNQLTVLDIRNCPALVELVDTETRTEYYSYGREVLISSQYEDENATRSLRYDETVSLTAFTLPETRLSLPADLTVVEDEAFRGCSEAYAVLPQTVTSIGAHAFAASPSLRFVYIPAATTSIDDTAFEGVGKLMIFGAARSEAESFAAEHGFGFIVAP